MKPSNFVFRLFVQSPFEYNARSQMTALIDAISQRYEFVYDPLGRRTQEKKGTVTMSFVYEGAGNRTQRTDYNCDSSRC